MPTSTISRAPQLTTRAALLLITALLALTLSSALTSEAHASYPPETTAESLWEGEAVDITAFVYQASGYTNHDCSSDCVTYYDQLSTDVDFARETSKLLTNVGMVPSLCNLMGADYSDVYFLNSGAQTVKVKVNPKYSGGRAMVVEMQIPAEPAIEPWSNPSYDSSLRCKPANTNFGATGVALSQDVMALHYAANLSWFQAGGYCNGPNAPSGFMVLQSTQLFRCWKPYTEEYSENHRQSFYLEYQSMLGGVTPFNGQTVKRTVSRQDPEPLWNGLEVDVNEEFLSGAYPVMVEAFRNHGSASVTGSRG